MKKIKFILSILVVICMLLLTSCAKGKNIKDVSEVEKLYNDAITEYSNSKAVQVKITLQNGEDTETIDLKYEYNGQSVNKLAAVLVNSTGEVSVYVVDGVAYMARYNSDKVYYTISADEQKTISSEYTFDSFLTELEAIYSASFFKASSLDSSTKTSAKVTCDVNSLQVDETLDGDAYFKQQDEIEKLQAMASVTLEVETDGTKLTKLVGTYVNSDNVTSKITVEFLGTTLDSVTVPNKEAYIAK